MRRIAWVIGLLVVTCAPMLAQRQRASLWCERGGQTVTVNGIVSSTKVQQSYVSGTTGCTVDVYDQGTTNHASICSDAACSIPITQPFVATSTGFITFFSQTEPKVVDVKLSGAGISGSFTIPGLQLCDIATTCAGSAGGSVTTVTRTDNAGHVAHLTITNPTTTPNIDITTDLTFPGTTQSVATTAASGFSDNNSPVCRDASGNLYTTGCSSASNALITNPSATQTAQGTSATVVSLQSECPSGAASTLDCFAIKSNGGTNVFETQQSGLSINSGYMRSLGFQNSLVSVAFSVTPTFNLTLGHTFAITLTANVTSSTLFGTVPSNFSQPVTFIITQDGTGGHSFVWPTNVLGAEPVNTAINGVSLQTFWYDGTNFRATGSSATSPSPGLIVTSSGIGAPAPLASSSCPTGQNPFAYILKADATYQDVASLDVTAVAPPTTPAGTINNCWRTYWNDSGLSMSGMKNNLIGIYHVMGHGGVTNSATLHERALGYAVDNSDAAFQNIEQLLGMYGEVQLTGSGLIWHGHAGGETDVSIHRTSFGDSRTGDASGSPSILTGYSSQMSRLTNGAVMSTSFGRWENYHAYMSNAANTALTGSAFINFFSDGNNTSGCSGSGCQFYGFFSNKPTNLWTTNYMFYSASVGTGSGDYDLLMSGVNSAGTPAGFNALVGPTALGAQAHCGAGIQVCITGGTMTIANQIVSSLATGTAPLSVTSTTPVANLTTVPTTYNHSGTQQTATHIVIDSCTLGTDCSVTLTGSSVFTSSSSYQCSALDKTAANAIRFNPSSGSAFALTGTNPDVISYQCIGN